jgi:hypothetical protein
VAEHDDLPSRNGSFTETAAGIAGEALTLRTSIWRCKIGLPWHSYVTDNSNGERHAEYPERQDVYDGRKIHEQFSCNGEQSLRTDSTKTDGVAAMTP